MLFHNIVNSSEDRIITKVIKYQMECTRRGTWYWSIQKLIERYKIKLKPDVKKSQWKKEVKHRIHITCEEEIREGCTNSTKGRTVLKDQYEMKQYLVQLPIDESKQILRMRTHMMDIPCNFGEHEYCWMCKKRETIGTEHYLECQETKLIRECVGIEKEHFSSTNILELVKLSKFFQLVEKKNVSNQKLCRWKK